MQALAYPEKNAVIVPFHNALGLNVNQFDKHMFIRHEDRDQLVVPYTIAACRQLASKGIKVKGPIRTEYHWPSKYPSPMAHQVDTADFMCQNPRSFCFNDIGTAKTLSSLWAADYLMSKGEMGKCLIITTTSTIKRTWEKEIFDNIPHRSVQLLTGEKKRRLKRLEEPSDFYVINHEGIKVVDILDQLHARKDITHIIVDEGARFRNKSTQLWAALNWIAQESTGRGLWWMTGDPCLGVPTNLWAQAKIVNPSIVPKYFGRFRDKTMVKISEFKWVPQRGWEDIVYAMMKPSIRFLRSECIDIPPAVTVEHEVPMSDLQRHAYQYMSEQFVIQMSNGEKIAAVNEGVKRNKLLQIGTGAIYSADKTVFDLAPVAKFERLRELIELSGQKVIVYTPFKHSLAWLAQGLRKDFSVGVVSGDVSVTQRDKIFEDFQESDLQVLVAHPKTMAHGLTLTATNYIVWWAPIDDYEIYDQASGRIQRPGQKNVPYIVHMYCTKAEQIVYKRLLSKESISGSLMDMLTT